jgi:uncharacterized membrane protein (UPF0127 family)
LVACGPTTWCDDAPHRAVAVFPSGKELSVEVAADPDARARGYMFRERVEPEEGMLFWFERADRHGFWMKNCRVSLDILWMDESFRIVDVAHEQQPCPMQGPCPTVQPMRAARYVLEVAGGTARREGLGPGDRVAILVEPPLP